jgi:hypothetical protein
VAVLEAPGTDVFRASYSAGHMPAGDATYIAYFDTTTQTYIAYFDTTTQVHDDYSNLISIAPGAPNDRLLFRVIWLGGVGYCQLVYWAFGSPRVFQAPTSLAIGLYQTVGVRAEYQHSIGRTTFYADYGDGTWISLGFADLTPFATITENGFPYTAGGREDADTQDKLRGNLFLAQVYDGIEGAGGTLVAEFNPSQSPGYGTGRSWTASTGEVWTGQGSARISAVNTLVYDTFTDADGTVLTSHTPDIGGPWAEAANSITIQSNRIQRTDGSGARGANIVGVGANVELSARQWWATNNYNQLAFRNTRGTAETPTWAVRARQVDLSIAEHDGSAIQQRAVVAITAVDGDTMFAWVEGQNITGSVSGESVNYSLASQNETEEKVGLYFSTNSGNQMDNFKVTSITDVPE